MAVTKQKEYIFNLMRNKAVANWKLLDGKEKIDEHAGNDIDESIVYLNSALDAFSGSGIVTIVLTKKNNDEFAEGGDLKTGVYKIKFDLTNKSIVSNNDNIDNIAGLIRQNENLKYENKIEQMQAQINSLTEMLSGVEEEEEEEEEKPVNVLMDQIKPYLPAITGAILYKLGLAPQQTVNQPINGIDYSINDTVDELAEIDPDIAIRLKKLVYLAKHDRNTYNLATNFLNNLVSDNKINETEN